MIVFDVYVYSLKFYKTYKLSLVLYIDYKIYSQQQFLTLFSVTFRLAGMLLAFIILSMINGLLLATPSQQRPLIENFYQRMNIGSQHR